MTLWRHQEEALDSAREHEGFLLWWQMASGKSYAAINILQILKSDLTLILCPKTTIKTWIDEFNKFAPNYFQIIAPLKGSVKKKAKEIEAILNYKLNKKPKVVILNFESCWRPGLGIEKDQYKNIINNGLLKSIVWDYVIADEIHRIKSPSSKVSKFVSKLKSKKRLGLSGTPTPNSPLDIYAIYRFLDPTIFSHSTPSGKKSLTYGHFKNKYARWGGFENRQVVEYINQEELNIKVYSIASRILTDDVIDLPDTLHIFKKCNLNRNARQAYDVFKKEAILQFSNGQELVAANVLTKYLRLAQIASGTIKDDAGIEHHIDDSKIQEVKSILIDSDEPIVIFTRFKNDIKQIKKMIKLSTQRGEMNRTVVELSGSKDERDTFKNGEADTICVNIQAGGTGVNELNRARIAIYFSTGYSNADFYQSLWRIRRPGSDLTQKIVYYHIMAKNTIDEVIAKAIERKQNIIDTVLKDFSREISE